MTCPAPISWRTALRKSAVSLLQAQGLRATSKGGHIAVQEPVTAQFGTAVRTFRSFGRIRRTRNTFEYPSSSAPGPAAEDVDDAVKVATEAHSAAVTILDQELLPPGSRERGPASDPMR